MKKISGKQNLGRKFGLAKFYFVLVRFVCVMLLITAKSNNNNTEFLWWVLVVGGLHTHNVVKPTSTWLWLRWVLTIHLYQGVSLVRNPYSASHNVFNDNSYTNVLNCVDNSLQFDRQIPHPANAGLCGVSCLNLFLSQ